MKNKLKAWLLEELSSEIVNRVAIVILAFGILLVSLSLVLGFFYPENPQTKLILPYLTIIAILFILCFLIVFISEIEMNGFLKGILLLLIVAVLILLIIYGFGITVPPVSISGGGGFNISTNST